MADLKALFAKKESNGQSGTVGVQAASNSNESPVVRPSTDGAGEVQATPPTPQATAGEPSSAKPKGFSFGVRGKSSGPAVESVPSSGTAGSGEQPSSGLSSIRVPTGASDSGSNSGGVAAPSLDSLDALNSSEDAGEQPSRSGLTYFADETPAQKPTRELPADLTKEQLGFVDMIDGIYTIIHDPDMLGGVIRNIMVELKSNSEYTKLMAPDDFRAMVRGMRESMGLARVKKSEAKAKRSGGSTRKSKQLDADVLEGLNDILGDI